MSKKLTIGMILAFMGALGFLFLTLDFLSGSTNADEYASETVLSQIPDKVNAIMSVATAGGIDAVILIILIIKYWDNVMNFNLFGLENKFNF